MFIIQNNKILGIWRVVCFCAMVISMVFALSLISVLVVSAISLVGIFIIWLSERFISKIVFFLVSLSVGVLFGDVFIHIVPEVFETVSPEKASLAILFGIIGFFILEKFVHWHHSHKTDDDCEDHSSDGHKVLRSIVLVGDGIHNLIDGIIITASYIVSFPLGIATTLAVIFHEIPQEIGNFGVLVHSGLSKWRALFFNFLSALTSVFGVIFTFALQGSLEQFSALALAFAGGGFIYIAGSDLVPELHKVKSPKASLIQLFAISLGVALMYFLVFLE